MQMVCQSDKDPSADLNNIKLTKDAAPTSNPLNDDVVPNKPSWFKNSQPDDGDDDWDPEQENVMELKKALLLLSTRT